MTARAKRAAKELIRRGWQVDEEDFFNSEIDCQQCGSSITIDSRFCNYCGARVDPITSESSIADLEAAIAAALKE